MYYNRRPHHQPRPKPLTQAQMEARRKQFDKAPLVVELSPPEPGRVYIPGVIITDGQGNLFKIVSHAVRYHEDCSGRLYGCAPARPTKEWKATCGIRAAIETVLRTGHQEEGSRAQQVVNGYLVPGEPCPPGVKLVEWRDGRPGSYASFPWIEVREGGILRAVRPEYDDSPVMAWVQDHKLAAQVQAWIAESPKPVHFPEGRPHKRATLSTEGG